MSFSDYSPVLHTPCATSLYAPSGSVLWHVILQLSSEPYANPLDPDSSLSNVNELYV